MQCTYPAVLDCLHPAAWTLLPADGWTEMTKLLVPGWLQAIFVKCNITLYMGCVGLQLQRNASSTYYGISGGCT